jgi:integrase
VTAARRAWNKAAAEIADWPKTKLTTKSLRGQLLLPLTQFPESFQEDVSAYAEKLSGENADAYFGVDEDPETSDDAKAPPASKPLRPLTIESKIQRIKSAANALHRSGLPLAEIQVLADLVTPIARPKAILKQLFLENERKPSPTLGHVAESLRQIAKHHVGLQAQDVSRIAKWGKEFGVKYKGMTTRNRKLLERVMTRDRRTTLYALPKVLLEEATEWGPCPRGALAAMRAAILVLLLKCPMRLGNVIGLRLDEHMVRPDPKTGLITAIIIPAVQTKNSRELVYPISEVTAGNLDRWLREFRPLGASPANPYLFPGKGDGPMTRQGVRDTIKAITEERLGVAINPHAFRHLAARIFLDARPGAYESVKQLLGHADVNTTIRSYCGTEGEAAMKQFDEILETDHQTLGMKKAPRPRLPKARKSERKGA